MESAVRPTPISEIQIPQRKNGEKKSTKLKTIQFRYLTDSIKKFESSKID